MHGERIHPIDVEAFGFAELGEDFGRPGAALAEGEVVAEEQLAHVQRAEKNPAHEGFRRHGREFGRKDHKHHKRHAGGFQQCKPCLRCLLYTSALILPKTMFSGRTAPLKCSAFQRQSALEQHAYGRPGVDVVDALGEKAGHGNDLQLRAHVQTFTGRDRVGDDDLGEHRVVEPRCV